MTTIQIDIDEVPVRIGKKGLELTEDTDVQSCGVSSFSVDVHIQDDGHWDITEVYPAIGHEIVAGKLVNKRGDKAEGPFASELAKLLEKFAEAEINDDVHDTIMQSDRRQFPKAMVV
jgi:hypothetical protein